jgi:thioredoxin 1
MTSKIKELDDKNFAEAVNDPERLVIVEFYSTTCPNCTAIAPVYAKLSEDKELDASFTKLNTQKAPAIAQRYGIMGTPTFKFFCKGEPVGEIVGAVNAVIIKNQIKEYMRHRRECRSKTTKMVFEMDGYG